MAATSKSHARISFAPRRKESRRLHSAIWLSGIKCHGRAQTYHASRMIAVWTHFKIQHVKISITCMKRLRTHPRHMTCESKLVWRKCDLQAYLKLAFRSFLFVVFTRSFLTVILKIGIKPLDYEGNKPELYCAAPFSGPGYMCALDVLFLLHIAVSPIPHLSSIEYLTEEVK
jgi:hypothetical protein